MLPVLNGIIQRFQDGPNKTYTSSDGTSFRPPPLSAMFTNDGQINQLVSEIGVFDDQTPLPSTYIPPQNKYVASHYVTMRGTIGFERLTCSSQHYVRITLNDVVYRKSWFCLQPRFSADTYHSCDFMQIWTGLFLSLGHVRRSDRQQDSRRW